MEKLTTQEIENLQKQLREITEEIKQIYDKLVEAGAVPLPDGFLDDIAGGGCGQKTHATAQVLMSIPLTVKVGHR